jgi:putative oxidoreductase
LAGRASTPGRPSVDAALGLGETGPGWALAAVAAGAAGSTLAIEAGRRAEEGASAGGSAPHRFARREDAEPSTVESAGVDG